MKVIIQIHYLLSQLSLIMTNLSQKNQKSIYHKYLIPIIGAFKLRYTDNNIKIVYVNLLNLNKKIRLIPANVMNTFIA